MHTAMIKYGIVLVLFIFSSGAVSIDYAHGEELTTLRWKNFSMQYPGDWAKDLDDDLNGQRMLRFRCTKTKLPVEIMLALTPGAPQPDTYYQKTPSLVALSYGYPLIKGSLGEAKANDVMTTFGEIQLQNGPAASAHLVGGTEDGKGVIAVQSFVLLEKNILLMGALFTVAPFGRVIEDPEYHTAIREAYAIMRSMQIQ